MKKTLLALLLLAGLFSSSLLNIRHIDELTAELEAGVAAAEQSWQQKDFASAASALDGVIARWREADGYTHVFIRHAEIDSASDCFFELSEAIRCEDADAAAAAAGKLRYHLQSIREMEHITLKSVL